MEWNICSLAKNLLNFDLNTLTFHLYSYYVEYLNLFMYTPSHQITITTEHS